jgi:hypothetical protein
VKIWTIHPVPYFENDFLRNHWMMEWNDLVMFALTNFYQHSDNNLALTVTAKFASDIYQYFKKIKVMLGTELLGLDRATVEADAFVFTPDMFDKYAPSDMVLNYEALDTPGNIFSLPTEVDLAVLFKGIPATLIVPCLKQYPIGMVPGATGVAGADTLDTTASAAGTGGIGGAGATAIGPGVTNATVSGAGGAAAATGIGPPTV